MITLVSSPFMPFWRKKEVNHVQYFYYHSAKLALFQYIEGWYNRKRIRGSIGYKTPQELENEIKAVAS